MRDEGAALAAEEVGGARVPVLSDVIGASSDALAERVANEIGDMVIRGALCPGERIVERRLCEVLGVSRTPMREALKLLRQDGLIEISRNCGARVTPYEAEDAEQLFEVIAALEGMAAAALHAACAAAGSGATECAARADGGVAARAAAGRILRRQQRGPRPDRIGVGKQSARGKPPEADAASAPRTLYGDNGRRAMGSGSLRARGVDRRDLRRRGARGGSRLA